MEQRESRDHNLCGRVYGPLSVKQYFSVRREKNPTERILLTSLTLSAKKEYGDSAAFFSSFLPCSRCSAAVRKVALPPELANAFELPFTGELLLLPLDFLFFFGSSSSSWSKSSSSSSSVATPDRREALERREDEDFMDLVSTSESEGTIKSSSSSEALERDRPVHIQTVELKKPNQFSDNMRI